MTEPLVLNAIGNNEEKSRPSSSAEDIVKKLRVILTYLFLSHSLIRMAEDITFLTRSALQVWKLPTWMKTGVRYSANILMISKNDKPTEEGRNNQSDFFEGGLPGNGS